MHLSRYALAMLTLGLLPSRGLADEPAKESQEKPQQERVHLGSASVTVVDEHEAVDDVITRIRSGKDKSPGDKSKDNTPVPHGGQDTPPAKDTSRASLQTARDRTSARDDNERRKDERRERAAAARARREQKRR